ncbi:MAG: hypothetical protein ACJA1A_001395 [Saprospiraceae bacterium]|jgi:hypothetical protein|tara:strand:- start:805 stop:924 length:120 start_codon:yes stop_codon:yes gene_type:complete
MLSHIIDIKAQQVVGIREAGEEMKSIEACKRRTETLKLF